jgi:hypothetical protein
MPLKGRSMGHALRNRLGQHSRSATPPAAGGFSLSGALNGGELANLIPDVLFYTEAPALDASQLPDGETITYTLIESRDDRLSDPNTTTTLGVQTGAGGAGAAAVIFACRAKYRGGSFIGLRVDASARANVAHEDFTLGVAAIAGT